MSNEMNINLLQSLNEQELAALVFAPFCCYCLKAQEPFEKFTSHYLRRVTGEISCPKLQIDGCSECGATGEFAHLKSECPLLEENSTIYSVPSVAITGGNGLDIKIVNTTDNIQRKRRKFKKERPLRVILLKCLHKRAVEKYWREMEQAFEAQGKQSFIEEEIKTPKISKRKSNNPRKRERVLVDESDDLICEDFESIQDCTTSRIKRYRHAF